MAYFLEAAYTNEAEPSRLRTAEEIDAFVAELLTAGWEHTAAAVYAIDDSTDPDRFPDHELLIGADAATGLGGLRWTGQGTFYSKGEQTNPQGVEFAYFGTGHEFPADAEVPLEIVREAMIGLLNGRGRRPDCVTWQEWS